jgi:hypothetical protein
MAIVQPGLVAFEIRRTFNEYIKSGKLLNIG